MLRLMAILGVMLCLAIPVQGARPRQAPAPLTFQAEPKVIARQVIAEGDKLCDAVLWPAEGSRPATVLATVDASGRAFCNGLLRITASGQPRILQSIDTWQLDTLAKVVADADKDGTTELVVPTPISDYEGANCIAVVRIVYACTGSQCSAARNGFQGFYASAARDLAQQARRPDASACVVMQRDKLLRLSGSDPRAGFAIAEKWMKSADPSLRRKAVNVFGDIGDAESLVRLRALMTDKDSTVSMKASWALRGR